MSIPVRPLFSRRADYLAIKPIPLGKDKTLTPGSPLTRRKFKAYHLASLFRRGMISPKGHPFTKFALQRYAAKLILKGYELDKLLSAPGADQDERYDARLHELKEIGRQLKALEKRIELPKIAPPEEVQVSADHLAQVPQPVGVTVNPPGEGEGASESDEETTE